jgi:hypothetical protein
MFPVWINDGTTEPPTDPIFYVVAKDGIYLKKTMGHFDTMNKVDAISILGECDTYASLDVAKITARQFTQILTLFRAVFKKYRAEANVILHYNRKRKRYRIDVPRQDVSGASVDYANGEDTYKDYIRIGTIHSHANMSAFHSGTDHGDELNWDGLHITLGKMDEEYFDISCSIMSGGERFMVQPSDYLEDVELVEYTEEVKWPRYTYVKGVRQEVSPEKKLGYASKAPEKDFCFPKKWMDKIDKYKPVTPKYVTTYDYSKFGYAGLGGSISEFYKNNSTDKQSGISKGQSNLFDHFDVGEDDWNPCGQCPYKHHKSDLMMQDLINSIDDEMADQLGFEEVDEKDDPKSPFHVKDETFGCDIDDSKQDGPTFGSKGE